MSSQHDFTDDPQAFGGPEPQASNATMILIAIAVVGGTLMLICGGVIVGGWMMARQVGKEFETAMADFETSPFFTNADLSQHNVYVRNGQYAEAVAECDRLLQQYPDDAVLHNAKAWLLATCPDDNVRDGKLAVEHATQACESTDWAVMEFVDTLAAAQAEAGHFEEAATTQQEAIDLDQAKAYASGFQIRLALYKSERPYREGVPAQPSLQLKRGESDQLLKNDVDSIVNDTPSDDSAAPAAKPADDNRDPFD